MGTHFIPSSYMVATIMNVKRKYLHENYVSKRELNLMTWNMQRYFNRLNIDALFLPDIDKYYFEDRGDIILLVDDYKDDFESIVEYFQKHLPTDIYALIWNEKIILSDLTDNFSNILHDRVKVYKKQIK